MTWGIHVGFFVLNYAKLAMLSYYYDVLEKYVTSDNFSVMEMDTDLLYVALAGYSLDDLSVKDQRMY